MDAVPFLDGARECVREGITSSLQPQNLRLRRGVRNLSEALTAREESPLLFDPTTAGGLLAAVPAEKAETCVAELRAAGYAHACVVGDVKEALPDDACVAEVLELE